MHDVEESLFSLELVVDKLYIPHVTCRFPAVAFRLLDFPTIIINHVEADLGKAIRRKVSFDPDYHLPEQFSELKDKHGNFMIKKGKSCLFKMVAASLKIHLSNTPLYVMVIDMFPEVPKLVGNSTVPLNILIDSICADQIKQGPSVPFMYGDKGLFKIYNLMGKEVGYFVLGFRLLCLGPSLIPHLPEASLIHRQSKKQLQQHNLENKQVVEMVQLSKDDDRDDEEADLKELRTTSSMTDPLKHDIMLQTVELDDKAVHVDIQATTNHIAVIKTPEILTRNLYHTGTQTYKKGIKTTLNAKKKLVEDLAAIGEQPNDDDVIITNIVCPPPLFYNSKAKPVIEIEEDNYSLETDMSETLIFDSLTDEEENLSPKKNNQVFSREHVHLENGQILPPPPPSSYQNVPFNAHFSGQCNHHRISSHKNAGQQQGQTFQSPAVFPLLSALLNELMFIQNPAMFQNSSHQPHSIPTTVGLIPAEQTAIETDGKAQQSKRSVELSEPQNKLMEIKTNVTEGDRESVVNVKDRIDYNVRKGHRKCAHPYPGVPKDKSWLRIIPEFGVKKSKLMFGLTNTQRLRLQKTNPGWLRAMEKSEPKNKISKQEMHHKHDSGDEFSATNLSDTLTEVRRQAQKELDKTAASDTLVFANEHRNSLSKLSSPKKNASKAWVKSPNRKPVNSSSKSKTHSPPSKHHVHPKHRRQSLRESMSSGLSDQDSRQLSIEGMGKRNTSLDLSSMSPSAYGEKDKNPLSARSDMHTSCSRSIEVRLPSINTVQDDVSVFTFTDSDEESVPLPDDSFNQNHSNARVLNFPGYLKQSASIPESIKGQLNLSLNTTAEMDENSPLESTRNSKNYNTDLGNSRIAPSTDDFDTKQFQSTSEPELQALLSDDDVQPPDSKNSAALGMKFPFINPLVSQQSPIPSTRRSVVKLDVNKNQQIESHRNGSNNTPPSSLSGSPKHPTPQPRRHLKDLKESINTDSISSYLPSDSEKMIGSFSSGEGNYSDEFQAHASGATMPTKIPSEQTRLIPSTKLGYTIH